MGTSADLPEAHINHQVDRLLKLTHDLSFKFIYIALDATICIMAQER
jgi:hypothetical protein